MIYSINSNNSKINWNAKGHERIIQNIINIINLCIYK